MKRFVHLLSLLFLFCNFWSINAQKADLELPSNYKTRHPIYDSLEKKLNNTDSVPGFMSKQNPLKIMGTVFLSDGATPAKDVILFITQPDEDGDYELRTRLKKRYVYHEAWVKTDADGRYTFYTFIPGNDRHSKTLKSIHLYIKAPNKMEYTADDYFFDDDPLLSHSCRERLALNGIQSILKPEKIENMRVATCDIFLKTTATQYIAK